MKTLLVLCAVASATLGLPPPGGRRYDLPEPTEASEPDTNRTGPKYPKEFPSNTYAKLWEDQLSLFDMQGALMQKQSKIFHDQSEKFNNFMKTQFEAIDDHFRELYEPTRRLNQQLKKLNEQVHAQTQAIERSPSDRLESLEHGFPQQWKSAIQIDRTEEPDKIGEIPQTGSKSSTFVAYTGPNGAVVVNDGHPNSKTWVKINGRVVPAEPGSVVIAKGDKFYSHKLPKKEDSDID